MEATIEQPNTKTFIWSMFGSDFVQQFERFNMLALVKGVHVTKLLSDLVEDHVKTQDFPGTLVDEKHLLEELQKANISVSRVTLRNYRINGKLVVDDGSENGLPISFTDGRNICYHLEKCLEFFRNRKLKNGTSPTL